MTEFFLGKRTYCSYAKETTYGQASNASKYSWPGLVQTITLNSKSDIMTINSMSDVETRNVSDYIETLRHYSVTLDFFVQHCRPLMFAFGSDTYSAGPPCVHTLTNETTLPSFTLNFGYQHTNDHALDYMGCMVNKMDLSCSKGEFLKCTMEVIAQDGTDHAFRSYQTGDAMKKYPAVGINSIRPFAYSDVEVTINDETYTQVDNIRMTINNNLLAEPTLNNDTNLRIAEPIPQIREFNASMTIRMATDNLYDLWETGTYADDDPTITFERGTNDKVVFTLEKAILESAISPFNITEGIVLVELPFKVKNIKVEETNNLDVDYTIAEV